MAETVTGLRLLSAASAEPQAIPGLPGLWSTEAELSVVPADLGIDVLDLKARAEEFGFKVEEVEWEREIEAAEDDEGGVLKAKDIKARIGDYTDEELVELLADDRSTVVDAARAEIEHREAFEVEPEPEA